MSEGFERERVNKAIGWLVSEMVADGSKLTAILVGACEELVLNLIHHRGNKQLRELSWYEVEQIWEIVLNDRP